ncbi:MAG TPA: alpha-2-macroglobulin family protein, partial [Anaerolineales bacterium]|nr:alpha-2-macroglobulin family protein [Anaerolineales bacterium]
VDVVSSLPLLVRPQTPRFFVIGDQVILGAAVHNNTAENLQVDVSLQAQGVTLLGEASQAVEIGAGQQAYVAWEALVEPTDADGSPISRVDLIFKAVGGGYSDTTRPTFGPLEGQGLPVYRYEAHETVGTSGQVPAGGTQVEAINLPSSWQAGEPHSGSLIVKVAPSLAAGMTDGLEYLKSYPYECVEQTVSRFLPNVVTTHALRAAGISDPELETGLKEQVNVALPRLYNWQNADGGWGWWNNQKSDPLTSAYVVLGLLEARDAGYSVTQANLDKGLAYLRRNLRPITRLEQPHLINRQAFLLYVLARAGEPDVSATVQMYDQRLELALYARAYLAHTLYWIDPADTRLPTLLSDFNTTAITSATGTHWEEASQDVYNWNSDTRTTAIILSAISEIDSQNPLNANAVRWLMAHRTNGYWNSTQETAWTILALTRWMVASGELNADYRYAVALNSNQLGDGTANAGNLRQTSEIKVDVNELLLGEANRLAIARDEGPGSLYYTAHLYVALPVEEVQALDQGIVVSRSYYSLDDPQTPIQEANIGDLLLARLTIVAPNTLHYLLVEDPWPAGLEGVDQSLNTSTQSVSPYQFNRDDFTRNGWGWWYFNHVEMRDEKLALSATELPPGTYVYTYLVRASTAGEFRTIPPTAQEFYFPEVYGRGEGSLFTVRQAEPTANIPESETQVDCSQIEHLAIDSVEAQDIVDQFTQNFKEQNPTEFMGMTILQGVDRLGEWVLVQGSVSGEGKDVIVAQQTEQGYQIAERYIITAPLASFEDGESRVPDYFLEKLPEAPDELFTCLDQSWLLSVGYTP